MTDTAIAPRRLKAAPATPSHRQKVPVAHTNPKTPLARRLRAIREELGMTPRQFAKRLRIGRSCYYQWEAGNNQPSYVAMTELCRHLDVTLDWIYAGVADGVPIPLMIRLRARMAGDDPDDYVAGEQRRKRTRAPADPDICGSDPKPAT